VTGTLAPTGKLHVVLYNVMLIDLLFAICLIDTLPVGPLVVAALTEQKSVPSWVFPE